MNAVLPFVDQAITFPPISPEVHSSPSIIKTCLGCPSEVPKSPFTPAIAPMFADIVLVSPHIG